jgi:hypothetical protein
MAATPQSQAINGANDLLFAMQVLQQARATCDNFLRQWTANGYGTIWNAMATTAQNADGSLGTADGTPNNAHVIDTRLAGAANLATPISATNLANAVTLLQALDAFFTNAVVATSNRDAIMNLFRAG